jgi:hypothetical protein
MEFDIKIPESHDYNVGDHIEFHKTTLQICIKHGVPPKDIGLRMEYEVKVNEEEKSFKWGGFSEFTEKKAIADHNRDSRIKGLTATLRAATKHFDPIICDHANHVLNLIKNYGDLVHADYDAETAGIDSLLSKLNSNDYALSVQTLNIEPWLVELEKYNNLFKSYVTDTELEQLKKPATSSKSIRKATDAALRKITNRITSRIDVDGPDEYIAFVTEFNIHVDHYNSLVHEHRGRLHAKIDVSNAEIETIAVQSYTGKPISVIPVVKISKEEKDGAVKIVELVFSKDFTVGYKNNVGIGTATLIITGIGKYSGEIVTTFNIVEIE